MVAVVTPRVKLNATEQPAAVLVVPHAALELCHHRYHGGVTRDSIIIITIIVERLAFLCCIFFCLIFCSSASSVRTCRLRCLQLCLVQCCRRGVVLHQTTNYHGT